MRHENTLRTARLGLLLAFALILGYAESLVPLPFGVPGMKLGLPNLAVLLTMYLFGNREALLVNAARVCLTAFLFGSLSSTSSADIVVFNRNVPPSLRSRTISNLKA